MLALARRPPAVPTTIFHTQAIRQYVGLFEEGAILDVIHKDILPAVRKNGSFWPPEWGGTAWDPNWVLL